MMSCASDSVTPMMRSFERGDRSDGARSGMAWRMICVTGERGEMIMLMPQ